MKQAAISELKASLSEYLAKVKKGEEIVVTDRGYPVARLLPFYSSNRGSEERVKLAREGIIELGKTGRAPKKLMKKASFADPSGSLLKALQEEREESL